MALVARGNGAGFYLTVSLTDTQGDVSTLRFELRSADYAEAVTATAAIVAAIAGVSQSLITSTAISFVSDEDTFVYPTGADNGVRARMTFQLADSVEKATLDIPAPKIGIFVDPTGPGNNVVDTSDTEVLAYLAVFKVSGNAFISDGEDADLLLRGKRTTR